MTYRLPEAFKGDLWRFAQQIVVSEVEKVMAAKKAEVADVERRIAALEAGVVEPDLGTVFASLRQARRDQIEAAHREAVIEADREFLARIANRYQADHAFGPLPEVER